MKWVHGLLVRELPTPYVVIGLVQIGNSPTVKRLYELGTGCGKDEDVNLILIGQRSVHENHRTCRTFPMARPKCPMRDFTNLNRIHKAHRTNVWWIMKVFRVHCQRKRNVTQCIAKRDAYLLHYSISLWQFVCNHGNFMLGHVTLVAITGTTKLAPYNYSVESLQPLWNLGTHSGFFKVLLSHALYSNEPHKVNFSASSRRSFPMGYRIFQCVIKPCQMYSDE